jgi:LPS export ABC transporter protein LptC
MRRRWDLLVLAFGVLFVLVLAVSFRPGRRPARSVSHETLPRVAPAEEAGQPTTVLKGFDYTETVRGQPLFRIQSERTVGFGAAAGFIPNVYVLEKVLLTLYPEQGAGVAVRSDRAEYDQRTKSARLMGNVRWTDDRGALGETERMEFNPSSRTLTAPEKIHLARGTFGLDARSGHYDAEQRTLFLDGPIRGSGTGQETGGLTSLVADAASYRREQSVVELSGSVEGKSKAGDTIYCDRFVLKLDREGRQLEWSRAEGRVHGVLASPPTAQAAKDSRRVPRRYTGDSATFALGSDGALRTISLSGSPATVVEPGRSVRAGTIDLYLQAGRIVSADAKGNVAIDADKSRAQSDQAKLAFTPEGDVETLELAHRVRMEGEGRSARADKAVNLPNQGQWVLTGGANDSATVDSGGSRISASRIEIDEKRHNLRAEGGARAVFLPGDSAHARAPAIMGDPSRPTYGKAARITLDEASKVATLSGGATLWQDASSLSGDDMTLNDQERSIVAVGHTRTVIVPRKREAQTPERESSVVVARRASYREGESTAQFEGDVRVDRGSSQASGRQAVAVFGKDRDVERVEVSGEVSLSDPAQGRSGRADRAVDFSREGRTVLEGSPAWVVDGQGNRVSGAVLTITDRGRRVEVTAPDGGKTETTHRTRNP